MALVSEIPWKEAVQRHAGEWAALVSSQKLDASMHFRWIEAIARAQDLTPSVRVLVASDHGRVSGLLPFTIRSVRSSGIPVRAFEPAGNLVSYHLGIVGSPEAADALLDFAIRELRWDLMKWERLVCDGSTAESLRRAAQRCSLPLEEVPGARSPFLPLPASWETLEGSLSRNFRKNLRRRFRELERHQDVHVSVHADVDSIPDLLDAMLSIESRSWKNGAGLAITQRPHERRYYESLLPWLASEDMLLGHVLWLEGQCIAYGLCCADFPRLSSLKASFASEWNQLAPGTLIKRMQIEHAIKQGFREFDFLGDALPHKLAWTTHIREHSNLVILNTSNRGRLLKMARGISRLVRLARP